MSQNKKIVVFLTIALTTIVLLWGTRGIYSAFAFWPEGK